MTRWQWTKTVKRIVERDRTCQLQLPGCTRTAETADHIIPRSCGGTNNDDNLRGACHHCNRSRGNGSRRSLASDQSGSAQRLGGIELPQQNHNDQNQYEQTTPKLVPWIG